MRLATGGALLSAVHLNRQAGMKPDVIHRAETDSIVGYADLLLIMNRQKDAPSAHMTLVTNRHGRAGDSWWTRFLPDVLDFSPIDLDPGETQS